jgi:hypothetical protein
MRGKFKKVIRHRIVPVVAIKEAENETPLAEALIEGGAALCRDYLQSGRYGALAITTPGDTSIANIKKVEKIMAGGSVRVDR